MIVYLIDDKYVTAVKEILVEKTRLVASAFEVRIIDAIPKMKPERYYIVS